jgi:hypothetical protein
VNVRLLGLTVKVGAGALSVNATFTVRVNPPPVTVIVPVLLPTVAVAWSTETVTVPLLDPLAGLTESQLRGSVTLQEPLEVIVKDWLAGLAAPCVPLNVRLVGLTVKVGVGALSEYVTLTVLVSPPPVIVIVPVLFPTFAVAWSTETVTVPLLDPLAGLTESQLSPSVTLQEPLEVIVNDWLAGLAAPCVPLNVRLVGLTVNVGEGAATVKETGIVCGEFVAPVPTTLIEAVCVAAESPETLAETVKDPGAAPEAGEIESHDAVLDAFQLNVPVPELAMFTVCAVGLLPP